MSWFVLLSSTTRMVPRDVFISSSATCSFLSWDSPPTEETAFSLNISCMALKRTDCMTGLPTAISIPCSSVLSKRSSRIMGSRRMTAGILTILGLTLILSTKLKAFSSGVS